MSMIAHKLCYGRATHNSRRWKSHICRSLLCGSSGLAVGAKSRFSERCRSDAVFAKHCLSRSKHVHIHAPVVSRYEEPTIGDYGGAEFRVVEFNSSLFAVP